MGNTLASVTKAKTVVKPTAALSVVPNDAAPAARSVNGDAHPPLANGDPKLRIDDSERDVNDVDRTLPAVLPVSMEAEAHILFAGTTNWCALSFRFGSSQSRSND